MSEHGEYRCFVGNLSPNISDTALEIAFAGFGHVVKAEVEMYSESKRFGFVTFDNKKSMEDAIVEMNGTILDELFIVVDKALPKQLEIDGVGKCHKCGEPGHFARGCTKGSTGGGRRHGGRSNRYEPFRGRHGGRSIIYGPFGSWRCHICGEPGHFARDCQRSTRGVGGSGSRSGHGGRYDTRSTRGVGRSGSRSGHGGRYDK